MNRSQITLTLGFLAMFFAATGVARRAESITFGQPDTENRFSNVGAIVVTEGLPGAPYIVGSCTLIHPRVVLTAGHVTASGEELLALGVPLFDISAISFGTNAFDPASWVKGVALVTHPNFGSGPEFPDVGLIILEEPVDLPCATLPYEGLLDDLRKAGLLVNQGDLAHLLAVGYGETLNFPPPEQITGDGPRRFSFPEYHSLTGTEILSNQNPAAGNSGLGAGDSGGPLFWIAPSGELIVVGIHRATDLQRVALAFDYRVDVPQTLGFIDFVIQMVEAGAYD
jgi:trypsin